MKLMKYIFGLVILTTSGLGFAGPGTDSFSVKEVRVEKGIAYIYPKTSIPNGLDCGGSTPVVLRPEDLGFKEMYSISLAALASGKNMKCWLRSCVSSPWGSTRPKAYACALLAD